MEQMENDVFLFYPFSIVVSKMHSNEAILFFLLTGIVGKA